jgi:hypothetical protein
MASCFNLGIGPLPPDPEGLSQSIRNLFQYFAPLGFAQKECVRLSVGTTGDLIGSRTFLGCSNGHPLVGLADEVIKQANTYRTIASQMCMCVKDCRLFAGVVVNLSNAFWDVRLSEGEIKAAATEVLAIAGRSETNAVSASESIQTLLRSLAEVSLLNERWKYDIHSLDR